MPDLCSDCPPPSYPTNETRCAECPRRKESNPDMTCGELIDALTALGVSRETEVVLRCEPEEGMGPCFKIGEVSIGYSHDEEPRLFIAIDGTQEID